MTTMPRTDLEAPAGEDVQASDVLPTVFAELADVGSARWTFAKDDDEDAPEVTCLLSDSDEALAQILSQSSRSEGHGLRSPIETYPPLKSRDRESVSFVVTLYL